MTTSALIMMTLGLGLTWGGAIFCMRLAMKKK